jgi:putative hemolysin
MKTIIFALMVVGLLLLFGCSQQGNDNNSVSATGADANGCINSLNYYWCEARQKCINITEEECGIPDAEPFPPANEIVNPASVNCVDNNGTLRIVDTNIGQIGVCTLPNGHECEEWSYFRGECS